MSGFNDARALRLERLESRSLLAAGVFDFALDADNDLEDQQKSNASSEVLSSEVLNSEVSRSEPFLQDDLQLGNEIQTRNQVNRQREVQPDLRQPRQARQLEPTPSAVTSAGNELFSATGRQAAAIAPSPIVQILPPVQIPVRQVAQANPANTAASATTPAIARNLGANETATESVAASYFTASSDDVSNANFTTFTQSEVSEAVEVQQANVQVRNAAFADAAEQIDDSDSGYIDLSLLESTDPKIESAINELAQSEPWKLDVGATWLLRRLAQQSPIDQQSPVDRLSQQQVTRELMDDRVQAVDQMMQDWFEGAGGLIALDQINLPASVLQLDALMIDVGLDSTVALHRSIGRDGDSITPAISGATLDAIMASLEQVAASEIQPVNDPPGIRIPVAAYPALAAVATTIAVTAHRKQKHPMQAVGKKAVGKKAR